MPTGLPRSNGLKNDKPDDFLVDIYLRNPTMSTATFAKKAAKVHKGRELAVKLLHFLQAGSDMLLPDFKELSNRNWLWSAPWATKVWHELQQRNLSKLQTRPNRANSVLTNGNPFLENPGRQKVEQGLTEILKEIETPEERQHLKDTPARFMRGLAELVSGVNQDPAAVLRTGFEESHYDQMITVEQIDFVSVCKHHLLPFHGVVHFAYLPNKRVVGLSKIPRMVEILARRPQIQEQLTHQIVQVFQSVVQPWGCAAMVEAWHACVGIRGIRKPNTRMRTTALSGWFRTKPAIKEEFLLAVLKGAGRG